MNYQLLIESYSFGTTLSKTEIQLLSLELDTQILNLDISTQSGFLKYAPTHICKGLKLRKGSLWITCLAEVIDLHQREHIKKTNGARVYDELLKRGLVIG
tara:strand:- start:244 stop:543 length:300 start_codon:yes stop_codon:yes gene_type:complete